MLWRATAFHVRRNSCSRPVVQEVFLNFLGFPGFFGLTLCRFKSISYMERSKRILVFPNCIEVHLNFRESTYTSVHRPPNLTGGEISRRIRPSRGSVPARARERPFLYVLGSMIWRNVNSISGQIANLPCTFSGPNSSSFPDRFPCSQDVVLRPRLTIRAFAPLVSMGASKIIFVAPAFGRAGESITAIGQLLWLTICLLRSYQS